ncbi:unnamed protein product [Brassica napus]|uniref:(rape) hypothetical protein n=1 Tax=Brassica napus TaxID=3708 RepID=A0A816NRA1_BRANA|nr:unnamed protein product [Brassica napus]
MQLYFSRRTIEPSSLAELMVPNSVEVVAPSNTKLTRLHIYSDPFTKASSLSQDHSFFESDASAEFMSSSLDYNSDVVGVTPNSYSPSLEYSSDLVGVTPISYCPSLDYNSDLVGVTPNSYSSSQDYRSDLVGLTPSSYSPSLDYSSDLVGVTPYSYFSSLSQLRSTGKKIGGSRRFATTVADGTKETYNKFSVTGEFAPVAIIGGFVALAVAMAGHSLKQQLMHAPGVSTRKNRRAAVAEVDDPDNCVSSADKYINKSWLRKVGQIQDKSSAILSDPTRPNPFTTPRNAETLKSVGVAPKGI